MKKIFKEERELLIMALMHWTLAWIALFKEDSVSFFFVFLGFSFWNVYLAWKYTHK